METLQALTQYYGSYDEDNRLCSRYGMVEYLTTMRYIEKYLRPGMRILEIGAATGRYSHYFAQQGYQVDAVELVEHNIEIFKKNTKSGENITITQGNAKDLNGFADGTYDITLLLGPMYHLFTEEEKLQALAEAIRVTKKGGIIFSAYCMGDASVLMYGFIRGEIHSGVLCGILDVLWVGEFNLERGREIASDKVESFVKKVAKLTGCESDDLGASVKHLEKLFPIPSDGNTPDFGGGLQHHLRDFAHHPTIVEAVQRYSTCPAR